MTPPAAKTADLPPIDPSLWRIGGADYDLKDFVERHPGGPIAIDLGRGIDCSRLFSLYHSEDSIAHAVLEKFRVSKDPKSLPHSEFHSDLVAMVRDHFKGQGKAAHKASYTRIATLSALFAFQLYCYYALFTGAWWSVPVLPLVAWVILANTSHDGSHFAFSDKWWVNHGLVFTAMPFVYNPLTWYSEHVVEHHCHCNESEHDVDLFHFYPMSLHKDNSSFGSLMHFSKVLISGLHLSFWVPLNCMTHGGLDRALFALDGHGFEGGKRIKLLSVFRSSVWHYASLVLTSILFPAFGVVQYYIHEGGFKGMVFALGPYVLSNFFFLAFTQVSHIQEGCQTEEALDCGGDFFKVQASTSMDYSVDSSFWNLMSGGLNVQALHHCLPWVSSCHYTDLYPKFLKICIRHGAKPQTAPHLLSAMQSGIAYVIKLNTSGRVHVK